MLNIVLLYSWDTAGQERFKCMAASYYRSAHGKFAFFLRTIKCNTLRTIKFKQIKEQQVHIFTPILSSLQQPPLHKWKLKHQLIKTTSKTTPNFQNNLLTNASLPVTDEQCIPKSILYCKKSPNLICTICCWSLFLFGFSLIDIF